MEAKFKRRLLLVGGLILAGLFLVALGNVIGAGAIFQGSPKTVNTFSTEMMVNADGTGQVIIYEGERVVQNSTFKKEQIDEIKKKMGVYEPGGVNKIQERIDSLFEIAKQDSGVKELIDGKEYHAIAYRPVDAYSRDGEVNKDTIYLTVTVKENNGFGISSEGIQEKRYEIAIDMNSEKVKSIDEMKTGNIRHGIAVLEDDKIVLLERGKPGEEFTNDTRKAHREAINKMFEIAKKDSRVQESIEGGEYDAVDLQAVEFISNRNSNIKGILTIRGKEDIDKIFHIAVDISGETVSLIYSLDELVEIAGKDPRVWELIGGKEYRVHHSGIDQHFINGKYTTKADLDIEDKGHTYWIILNLDNGTVERIVVNEKIDIVKRGNNTLVYKSGELIKNVTIPEGGEYISDFEIETKDTDASGFGGVHMSTLKLSNNDSDKIENMCPDCLEIAKKDPRVQELIEGKDYKTAGMGTSFKGIDYLVLDVEGERYEIIIDRNNDSVKHVFKYLEIDEPLMF